MNNWKYRLYQFMQGRYGMDSFGRFLLIVSLIVVLLSNFRFLHILYLPGILLLAYVYFRMMSKNIYKRQSENQKYLNIKAKFSGKRGGGTGFFRSKTNAAGAGWNVNQASQGAAGDNSQYNFYRCRSCGQVIRVPKGKGTLRITCPKCGNSFVDQT